MHASMGANAHLQHDNTEPWYYKLCIQQVQKDGHYTVAFKKKQYKGKSSGNVQFIVSVLHLMQGLDISCLTYPHSFLHISVSSQNYSASKTSNSSHWNESNFLC